MSDKFSHLTQPGRIGSMEVKNRMIVSAMVVNLAEEGGICGERITSFHERQARGGAGLIVLGVTGVAWPHGGNMPRQVAISDDRFIAGLKTLTSRVQQHGTKIAAQLHHAGLVAAQDAKEGRPIWVPSFPKPPKVNNLTDGMLETELMAFYDPDAPPPQLHVMTQEDINLLVKHFADAAGRAQRAGFDAIEIHGGHGYIISEFISPAMNNREDKYGGSLENRARLLTEILYAIRQRVGSDFPVWCKLDSVEYGKEDGITLDDAKVTAQLAEQAGANAITVSSYHDPNRGALHSESNIPHVPNRMVTNAAAIKDGISIPVIASGRIEPDSAEQHIRKGYYDFLGMGRKMLADPDLPNKIKIGETEQIRPCVYCYCCVSQIYILKPVKCAVNPETAFENTTRQLIATDKPRHIAVIGGGPGGMETARRLSIRGFKVSLFESGKRLGGTLQFASIAYTPNERLMDWLRLQIKNSDVEVNLNTTATVETITRLNVEEVIVATGATRDMPSGIPGSHRDFVLSGEEMRALVLSEQHPELKRKTSFFTRLMVLAGSLTGATGFPGLLRQATRAWLPLGKKITIIGNELVGLELAEFLAERGRKVTVIDNAGRAGKGLYLVRRLRMLEELEDLGVVIINKADKITINDQAVTYISKQGDKGCIDADHVIVAKGATGNTSLAEAFKEAGFKTHVVGDCNSVSYIEGAMEAAAELTATL